MRIGISVITEKNQNIWSNGLTQNVVFLARLFQAIPFVESVVFVDAGNHSAMASGVERLVPGVAVVPVANCTDLVDVVIEMAGGLDVQWLDYMRACGKKVIGYAAGHPYSGLVEPPVFNVPGYSTRLNRYDIVWYIPKNKPFNQMLRALHRCPTTEVPYLWSPAFLEQRIAEVSQAGYQFGYVRRKADEKGIKPPLKVAIFEPNISVVKTSSISILACDVAYRANPNSVGHMSALNTLHMTKHNTLLHLANSLNLVKDHKAVFVGRHDIVGFMAIEANAVVSHHWENEQNYSYLDALYGNYPLVHNSSWIKDFGYYYPDFDCREGGRQLVNAYENHDENLANEGQKVRALFASLDPLAPANVEVYARLLSDLTGVTQ